MTREKRKPAAVIKLALYIVCMLLFVVYFLFAGQIIGPILDGGKGMKKLKDGLDALPATAPAVGWVDSVEYLGGVKSEVVIEGIAFCESEEALPRGKTVDVILYSEGRSYRTAAGVMASRPTLEKIQDDYRLGSTTIAYTAIFSALPLRTGEYEVCLYVQESDTLTGLVHTGTMVTVAPGNVYDTAAGPGGAAPAPADGAADDAIA